MLIVDSQLHIWQNAKMRPPQRQVLNYTIEDAVAEMESAGVDCAVLHPPTNLDESSNVYAIEAVRRHPDKFCILGHFDVVAPDREDIVARWRDRPGMLGFRFTFNKAHQLSWWTDGTLDWLWAACEKANLPIALRAYGPNLAVIDRVAERHPGLKLLIDHLGRGRGRDGKDDLGFADLPDTLALARHPNVAIKLSGTPSNSSAAYPYNNIHRYLREIVLTFGPDRCFWGTDLTRIAISYRQCVTMFTEELPWLKGHDLERVMGAAIVDWLGWKRPSGQ